MSDTKYTICVGEDQYAISRLLKVTLENAGFDVIQAKNGHEVLKAVNSENINLILLDSMMPSMDGITTLEKLKGRSATQDIPVIMCTAKSERNYILDCIKNGAVDIILKPFKGNTLINKVNKILCVEPKVVIGKAGNESKHDENKKSFREEKEQALQIAKDLLSEKYNIQQCDAVLGTLTTEWRNRSPEGYSETSRYESVKERVTVEVLRDRINVKLSISGYNSSDDNWETIDSETLPRYQSLQNKILKSIKEKITETS